MKKIKDQSQVQIKIQVRLDDYIFIFGFKAISVIYYLSIKA